MQTSTITVAVLPDVSPQDVVIRPQDVDVSTCRGSGAGGQHRNKTDSAVLLKHRPTGIQVRVESERSQHQNRETAFAVLRARIRQQEQDAVRSARDKDRKTQVGVGARGDKRRTIRMQDDQVVDHVTGKKLAAGKYLKGHVEALQ